MPEPPYNTGDVERSIVTSLVEFLREYHHDDLATLARDKGDRLWISYCDLRNYDMALADDLCEHPQYLLWHIGLAIKEIDIPLADAQSVLADVEVAIYDMPDHTHQTPGEIRSDDGLRYVAIDGILERVTSTSDVPNTLVYECERCGAKIERIQDIHTSGSNEPYECTGCERQGPFTVRHRESDWSDYAKLRVEAPPDASESDSGVLTGYVLDDLIDRGGPSGLLSRAGEPVTVYGILRRQQKDGTGENDLLFDHVLDVRAIEFDRDDETISIADHRDDFETLADRPDAVDLFAESIAPQLHATDAWTAAMEFAVAYLFGAPRVDIPNGPTYRGDLHFLIMSDYGTGKSTFKGDIAAYSPKCINKSTTALSSGVGLTAAAVKDDFGEGQWTIKPGLLVRASGGHLILDEIDKGPDELTKMNDALEGEQLVDIEKAGKSVTYESRTALLAMGNPVDGRFDRHEPIADQLGIADSLISRFDGIITMQDSADTEMDHKIAETYGKSYTEAQQTQYGDRETLDQLDREVPIDTGQAWIEHARENVTPTLTYEQFETLEDWYAEEVRQLNGGGDKPVPVTVRVLAATVKMAVAFARARLQDSVETPQIERAKKLAKRLVEQNWDGEQFDASKHYSSAPETQGDRREAVWQAIDSGATTVAEVAEETDLTTKQAQHDIDKLKQKGELYEPESGEYRTT